MKKAALSLLTSTGLLLLNSACVAPNSSPDPDIVKTERQATAVEISAVSMALPAKNSNLHSNANLSRDDKIQVVTDKSSKLQWEDNALEPIQKTWGQANEHCNNLDFADHQDWRLPTTEELVALAKATKVKFSEKPILKNIPNFDKDFWTSKVLAGNGAEAVDFEYFDYGKAGQAMQNLEYSVRCVRNLR